MTLPDVVQLTIAYLSPILAPVPVQSRVPYQATPRPPVLQVRRVGGPALAPVRDQARLDVWAWADTEAEAWQIALSARAAIWALSGTSLLGPMVYTVTEFMGPRNEDDTISGTPRVWATYELGVRANQLIQPAN